MSKIFLGGGGDIETSYSFDSIFFNSLPQNADILYIPVAMATTAIKTESAIDWFSRLVSYHSNDDRFIDFTVWNGEDALPVLNNYDAVYIGGGNTYRLLMILEKTGMLDALKDHIRKGGMYYGGSAGAVIVGKSLKTIEEENVMHYARHDGMNLINNLSLSPHFSDDTENGGVIRDICQKHTLSIVAISEDSGLILDGSGVTVFGAACVYEYEKETIFYTSGQLIK